MNVSKYAANTKTKKWGRGIFFLSIFGVFAGLITGDIGTAILIAVFYAVMAGVGFYLWTSEVPSEYFSKKTSDKKAQADRAIMSALERLQGLTGAKAFIAFERLENLVQAAYKDDASRKLTELLESVDFDRARVESKFIGGIGNLGAGVALVTAGPDKYIRVYKDWVIAGNLGFDFDVSTRGEVTLDDSMQRGRDPKLADYRKAALHLATQDWSHTFEIYPSQANEAKRILLQLEAIIDQMKPKAVSAAEIGEVMERLVGSTGKSPAEKLEELSNLRYQRLLSDKEFEAAKQKILGI